MDLNSLKLDLKKEVDGIWVPIDATTELLIARMHNPNFNKLFERLSAPFRQSARKGIMGDEKAQELMNTVIAKTVIVGWKGLSRDGKNIKYSEAVALELLNDKTLSSFRELIIDIASNEANFRDVEISETGKKSVPSSNGNKNGDNH